jgi:uncharacterized protein HemX
MAVIAGAVFGALAMALWLAYDSVAGEAERQARLVEIAQEIQQHEIEAARLRNNAARLAQNQPHIAQMALDNAITQDHRLRLAQSEADRIRSGPRWEEALLVAGIVGATVFGFVPAALAVWFLFLSMIRQVGAAARGQDD